MLTKTIPGFGEIIIQTVLFDMNGTISTDGEIPGPTKERLRKLAQFCSLSVVTADTFGTAATVFQELPVTLKILTGEACSQKKELIDELGTNSTVAFGNGNNDVLMLREAKIGICVIGKEGASVAAMTAADIVVNSIDDGLDLLLNTDRLKATLRM